MLKKLNFGCGSIQPTDWDNVDKDTDFYNGKDKNFFTSTQFFADNTYDIIVAHCTIQITEWHDLPQLFKELRRILKPGGILRISLPDIARGIFAYDNNEIEWFPNGEENIHERFCAWLTWYSTSKTLLVPEALHEKLKQAGFINLVRVTYHLSICKNIEEAIELDTRKNECYFFEAMK